MGIGAAIGGGISALGSLFGSSSSAKAAKQAAQAQLQATQIAAQTQRDALSTAKNALQPYMDLGQQGASQLGNRLTDLTSSIPVPTMTQSDLEATPGYQFTLGQGLKATQNSAAARGLGASGAAMKGAASYATGLSDSTYNERFNQAQTQFQDQQSNQTNAFNKLYATAGVGTQAAGALAGQSITAGQGIANTQMQGGAAQAAGINGAVQANAAGLTGASGAFSNALAQYMAGSTLKNLPGFGNGTSTIFGDAADKIKGLFSAAGGGY